MKNPKFFFEFVGRIEELAKKEEFVDELDLFQIHLPGRQVFNIGCNQRFAKIYESTPVSLIGKPWICCCKF